MDKIEKIRQEIERRRLHFNKEAEKYQALNNGYSQNCYGARDALRDLENFLDTLSEEPDKSLEEAAEEKYPVYWKSYPKDGIVRSESSYDTNKQCREAFIAGAEWQKEQDQPITGNSLEQEWLRYVDKKKKECGGELPALGEYGWLQIARHFAEWQKSSMLKDAEECELYWDGDFLAIDLNMAALGYSEKDKVRIIIMKEDEQI